MRTKSTGGFTLIELLIVIAIIGILAAVLIPNLLSARTRSFETAAQACAKGFATAAEIHQIDSRTYSGMDLSFVRSNGGNACASGSTGAVLSIGSLTGSTYSATVSHTSGGRTVTVTQEGITLP